jgi:pSer/pThr/pTyr-binding forkhead associated (FHA) protein
VATASTTQAPVEAVVFHDTYVEPSPRSAKYAETVRFRRPSEEPVQLLPGRLEVLSGESKHREIRFVRVPGEPLQLVVGRDPGVPSPRHVALQSSTVSRQHARFQFADGKWAVANLSRTNPVIVNDEHLSDTAGERTLADGDRIELGEVVLRFRAH